MRRLGSFVVAGGTGFLVDALALQLLAVQLGMQVHLAKLLSFLLAVISTWLINRRFTFPGRAGRVPLPLEFWRYLLSSLAGGTVNYLVFAATISASGFARTHLYVAVAMGSLAGMLVNFVLYSVYVFRRGFDANA